MRASARVCRGRHVGFAPDSSVGSTTNYRRPDPRPTPPVVRRVVASPPCAFSTVGVGPPVRKRMTTMHIGARCSCVIHAVSARRSRCPHRSTGTTLHPGPRRLLTTPTQPLVVVPVSGIAQPRGPRPEPGAKGRVRQIEEEVLGRRSGPASPRSLRRRTTQYPPAAPPRTRAWLGPRRAGDSTRRSTRENSNQDPVGDSRGEETGLLSRPRAPTTHRPHFVLTKRDARILKRGGASHPMCVAWHRCSVRCSVTLTWTT